LLGSGIALVAWGFIQPSMAKLTALATCFICFLALNTGLAPLEGEIGRYDTQAIAHVQDKLVAVPCDFRAKDEEYRLLLPGARLQGYPASEAANGTELAKRYPYFAAYSPLGAPPAFCDDCQVVGKRMEMRSRHSQEEIVAIIRGEMGQYLFVNEYLIYSPSAVATATPDACR
jgi:hypothetical protein